jgi:hypothetical protein
MSRTGRQLGALAFLCGDAHVKSIRIGRDVDWEPLAFCTWHCACKKYKDRTELQSRGLFFLLVLVH